jgi:tetratricopeptide (TPR) repeat protein
LPAAAGGALVGAGIANRIGDRPAATLPGLGNGRANISQLPANVRRDQLANRLRGDDFLRNGLERPSQLPARDWNQVRNDWQDHRNDIRNDWQDYRNEVRDDWQDWRDDRFPWHSGWYWGYAAGYWNRWDYLWDEHPVAAAVGLTWWGANTLGYGFGYEDYYNPYYEDTGSYSYAEPIVTPVYVPVEGQPAAAPVEPSQESLDKFTQAQAAFSQGNYDDALRLVDEAAVQWPKDAVLHEFRSLVLFALKRYSESAAAIHAVLAVGPGWDWKTLSSLYGNVDAYTSQLRALEAYCKANPKAADTRFLLGYHYLTMGHSDAALTEFRMASELQPKDEVSASLVRSLSPRDTESQATSEAAPPTAVPAADVAGSWEATGKDSSKYSMTLTKEGTFLWSFTKGTRKEEVKGVYSVEGNVLAMEPETGGVLLAEMTLKSPGNLAFKMVGADQSDPGLEFQRSNG